MQNTLGTMILAICLCLSHASLAQQPPSFPSSLKLACSHWPPFDDVTNIERPGFSTEVIIQVMENMNVEVKIEEFPWVRALKSTQDANTAGLFSSFYTDERAEYLYYPQEALTSAKYILFAYSKGKTKLNYKQVEDLIDKKIGILRAAAYPKEFIAYIKQHAHVTELSSEEQLFKMLSYGRFDYIIAEQGNGRILAAKLDILDKITPFPMRPVKEKDIYLVFNQSLVSKEFVAYFSRELQQFKLTKQYQAIYRKYFDFHHQAVIVIEDKLMLPSHQRKSHNTLSHQALSHQARNAAGRISDTKMLIYLAK